MNWVIQVKISIVEDLLDTFQEKSCLLQLWALHVRSSKSMAQ